MKIGIDIDDTLTSLSEIFYTKMQKWCIEKEGFSFNSEEILSAKVYSNIKNYHKYWEEIMMDKVLSMDCKIGAKQIIDKLIEDGHEIYLITARSNDYYKEYKEKTLVWLKNKEINYNEIYFECQNKEKILKDLGIEIMIDDNIQVMESVNELGIKGIIMNTFFNTAYDKCDRAYTWYDVYYYINKLR